MRDRAAWDNLPGYDRWLYGGGEAARAARIARTGEGRVHSTDPWKRAIESERASEARSWLQINGRDVADAMVMASDQARYELILALTGADG